MRKELRKRIATEYRYAAKKMKEALPERKMYYFSVLYGEAQRILNFEWDRDLALVHAISQHSYKIINDQSPMLGKLLSIDMITIHDSLTQIVSDLASYYEKAEDKGNIEELYQILGRLAEITYVTVGNGNYLFEKGVIKL
jgi:hypothetical protein